MMVGKERIRLPGTAPGARSLTGLGALSLPGRINEALLKNRPHH
jgi:hypothetical protein